LVALIMRNLNVDTIGLNPSQTLCISAYDIALAILHKSHPINAC